MPLTPSCHRPPKAFSLIELLVSFAVLSLLLVVMMSVINHSTGLWQSANTRIEAFQSARLGFDNLTRLLSQATLNTYWDYHPSQSGNNPSPPEAYMRKSELHFLVDDASALLGGGNFYGQAVFFQAPAIYSTDPGTGDSNPEYDHLTGLLNACGFFVEFASDEDKGWIPDHVESPARSRFRLMQWMEPTQSLSIFDAGVAEDEWINRAAVLAQANPAADNVIALVIWPREPEGHAGSELLDYSYDSRENVEPTGDPPRQFPTANQLPPMLQVALVAIDENSAVRLGDSLQSTVEGCLDGLFKGNPEDGFASDLEVLEEKLTENGINHRVFVSAIPMREAKWSAQ